MNTRPSGSTQSPPGSLNVASVSNVSLAMMKTSHSNRVPT